MTENWIIPCNIKFFDLPRHFEQRKTVVWRKAFAIHKGDIAYIYISSPYCEIRYKCLVINDQVDDELLHANPYAISTKSSHNGISKKENYIEMEYICEYPKGTFPLEKLREQGLGQVQIQARTDRKLQAYLLDVESHLGKGGGN